MNQVKETTIRLKKNFINKITKGYPLIEKNAVIDTNKLTHEGMVIKLVDNNNKFIAKGYYGKQNKGNGWILTYDEQTKIDYDFFRDRLNKAINLRKEFYNNQDTTAFRIFNGEGDNIGGLTIDYFDGYYLINWYSEGIYMFREYIIKALSELTDYKGIYQKKRFNDGGKYIDDDDFVIGERGNFPIIVKENGVKFAVYLNEGAMVGFFIDQRDVRNIIKEKYAKNKNVLNTFSYTGAFSVFAAKGGAKKTTSVDLANRSRKKTVEQFEINNINADEQDIIVEDVFKYFKYAVKKQLLFDLVILDPPSFAKSKKHTFSASKDYTNLLKEAILITEKSGIIIASTNCSSFDMKRFKEFVDKAFHETNTQYNIVEEFYLPTDFKINTKYKESNYLKVLFIKKS
ncbi:class I SAM-dependent rRNA methyltransferase [Vallitalea guaymasensis]|uniref:Class I SAM-dependent rRNA methyltransferase n=1 Tax=Vallitalea guaymasensis TaxID=1185412 RepID=A0A8J8SBX3_9FIRM|nr:class I SAM-dependent rRNA methyltransferase [Vallitalea guaymasensis]